MSSSQQNNSNTVNNVNVNDKEIKEKIYEDKYTNTWNTGWHPGNTNKSKDDPDFSWHHHTPEGRKVLSGLSDSFYMD